MDMSNLLRFLICQQRVDSVSSMLVSKFFVPVTRHISVNLQKLLVHSASKSSCSDDIKRICKPQREKIGGRIIRSRCEEYKTAVEKCPKTSCKTDSQIPPPKCNSKISDTYLDSLKTIEDSAKKFAKLIEKSTDQILKDLDTEIEQRTIEESSKRQEILKSVEEKIWELIHLDNICGIKKKWDVLMINDKLAHDLNFSKCDNSPDVKFLRLEIQNIKNEAKCQIDSAIGLIKSCRKSYSPFSLKNCVEKNTEVSLQIVDRANKNASKKIADMQDLKTRTVKEFGKVLGDITESYRKDIKIVSEHLSQCIDYIKRHGSLKRNYI